MGKRTSAGLTGLARIAQEVFKPSSSTPDATQEYEGQLVVEAASSSTTTAAAAQETRLTKRRKTNRGTVNDASRVAGWEGKYDSTGLVPHYRRAHEVPDHLQKCTKVMFYMMSTAALNQRIPDFSQRKRYFSLYDSGCLLDEEGWYSVTPERVAEQIAERCRCDTILDAFCGVGGNAIAFAKTCERGVFESIRPPCLALRHCHSHSFRYVPDPSGASTTQRADLRCCRPHRVYPDRLRFVRAFVPFVAIRKACEESRRGVFEPTVGRTGVFVR
jgi:trimethylguanosine synthase